MAGVRIVTDSACDLPDSLIDKWGITVVPLSIRFGDEEFVDRFELSAADFYKKMADSSMLPETAAPAPGAFAAAFSELAEQGAEAVVCIDLSSELSATMASAGNAAKGFSPSGADDLIKLDVRVLDSRSITAGLGLQVLAAAEAAEAGKSADEIVAIVEDLSTRTVVLGALDTLDNLKKGGRIGGAQAMLGTMLSIKPIIDISTGVVEEAGKQRTRRKAMNHLRNKLIEAGPVENLCICSGEAPDVDEFKALLAEKVDISDALEMTIGATIGAHGGPRMLGLVWQRP